MDANPIQSGATGHCFPLNFFSGRWSGRHVLSVRFEQELDLVATVVCSERLQDS
jgi:hypothetical protein